MKDLIEEIQNIIFTFIEFKPCSKKELKTAVDLWCEDKKKALNRYGHISTWNMSQITDMSALFYHKKEFDDDIANWDVSNVKNMSNMFSYVDLFNQPLNKWNVSNVRNMADMFFSTKLFNQPLNKWDVSNDKYVSNV